MYKEFLNIKSQLLISDQATFEVEGIKILLDTSPEKSWSFSTYFANVSGYQLCRLGFSPSGTLPLQSYGCQLRYDAISGVVFLEKTTGSFNSFTEFRRSVLSFLSHVEAWSASFGDLEKIYC